MTIPTLDPTSRGRRGAPIPLALFGLAVAIASACVQLKPLDGLPCPCAAGWTCCEAEGVCVPAPADCESLEPLPDAGSAGPDGGADAGPDPDAGSDAGAGADAGWGPMENVNLTGVGPYCYGPSWSPRAGGETMMVSSRLTPPSYPFRVEKVLYALRHGYVAATGVNCQAGLAHSAELFVAAASWPPEIPEPLRTLAVPTASVGSEEPGRTVEFPLDEPLVIDSGELFIAVRAAGVFPDVICFGLCTSSEGSRSFYATTNQPPYSWGDLMDIGSPGNFSVRAVGRRWMK